jgi:hypothetical protein
MPLLPHGEADLRRAIYEAVTAGDLYVLGSDGEVRAVTSETGIALNQSGLRLARPEEVEPAADDASGDADDQGSDHPDGDGHTGGGAGGSGSAAGGAGGTGPTVDHEVAITLTANLDDTARAHAIYSLLLEIAEAVDGEASHVQLMAKVVAPQTAAEKVEESAHAASANVNSRPLPA